MAKLVSQFLPTILIIIVTSFVMLEIVLRLSAMFPSDTSMFVNDSDIGYRMRPHVKIGEHSKTNSFGFNDVEHENARRVGGVRIAIIGDSFVFGAVPRAQNFTFVIQRLAAAAAVDVEVLNMGIAAAGPQNYLALLKNDAVWMNADIVCVVFFVGNDIVQSHPDFKTVVWLGATRQVLRRPYSLGLSKEYYYVYRLMRSMTRLLRERINTPSNTTFTRATYLAIEHQRSHIYRLNKSFFIRQGYTGATDLLKTISREAELANKLLFIVLAPDELQVNPSLQMELALEYNMNLDDYNFSEPQRIIAGELRASGVSVIDLLPVFKAEQHQQDLYIPQDSHWNTAGNQLAAEIVWSALKETIAAFTVLSKSHGHSLRTAP